MWLCLLEQPATQAAVKARSTEHAMLKGGWQALISLQSKATSSKLRGR
jgi:hypothetical protein